MKRVLSISLGSSKRDSIAEIEVLGETFVLERRGTDGSLRRFAQFMAQSDGVVDCLCVGGTNLGLYSGGRYYPFREITNATRCVKRTPLVDGSGVENTLERRTLHFLQDRGMIDFASDKVLLTCGIDRFGMAEELHEMGAEVVFGDLIFNLDLPLPVRSLRGLRRVGRTLLPLMTRVPFKWLYPTGDKQDAMLRKHAQWFADADLVAGDFHYLRRYMPDDLAGKTVLTNTITADDVAALTERGVRYLVTSAPVLGERTFATNVIDGMFICLLGKDPADVTDDDYLQLAERLDWEPTVRELNPSVEGEVTT